MVSPTRRRDAVEHVQGALGVSQRRACRTLDQPRGTQRYRPKVKDDETALVKRMHELVRQHPRLRLSTDLGPVADGGLARESQTHLAAMET